MQGGDIDENTLIGHEILNFLFQRDGIKQRLTTIELDTEKANDIRTETIQKCFIDLDFF